jgi:hypothetical protein
LRLPLLLSAAGALLGSFGVAGLANGMWASPSAWEHSRAGFQIALGLPYGDKNTPIFFSRPDRLAVTEAASQEPTPIDGIKSAPAHLASAGLAKPKSGATTSCSRQMAISGEQTLLLAQSRQPHFLHSFLTARVEPPAPPAPPAPPEAIMAVHAPTSVHDSMDPAFAQEMARADRQVLRAAQASLKAAQVASKSSTLVSTIEFEISAVAAEDLRQAQREVSEAKAMLRVAQTMANRVQAGDFSKFSVNYDRQTRCGSANLVSGCLPLKPSDMAKIRAESAQQLAQAQLDLRQAQESLALAQQVDPTHRSTQSRLTDG